MHAAIKQTYGSTLHALQKLQAIRSIQARIAQSMVHEIHGDGCRPTAAQLAEALKLSPNSIVVHVLLSRVYLLCGEARLALSTLQSAIALDANNAAVWVLLGYVQVCVICMWHQLNLFVIYYVFTYP